MCNKGLIQSSRGDVGLPPAEHTGTAGPEDRHRLRPVLPPILLEGGEESPSAEGVAQPIHVASECAGVLKTLRLALPTDRRLDGDHLGVAVEEGDQRLQPALRHEDVVIEEADVVVPLQLDDGSIVPRSKAEVAPERKRHRLRVVPLQDLEGVVRAAVVCLDHVCQLRVGMLEQGREVVWDQRGAVPVEYDDGNLFPHTGTPSTKSGCPGTT